MSVWVVEGTGLENRHTEQVSGVRILPHPFFTECENVKEMIFFFTNWSQILGEIQNLGKRRNEKIQMHEKSMVFDNERDFILSQFKNGVFLGNWRWHDWVISSVGRAIRLQRKGQWFESIITHISWNPVTKNLFVVAGVVKLVDTPGLGPGAFWSYRFESCHPYFSKFSLKMRKKCSYAKNERVPFLFFYSHQRNGLCHDFFLNSTFSSSHWTSTSGILFLSKHQKIFLKKMKIWKLMKLIRIWCHKSKKFSFFRFVKKKTCLKKKKRPFLFFRIGGDVV